MIDFHIFLISPAQVKHEANWILLFIACTGLGDPVLPVSGRHQWSIAAATGRLKVAPAQTALALFKCGGSFEIALNH